MIDEEENRDEEDNRSPFTLTNLNRIIAILFVLGIYLIIYLKILVLE